MVSIACVLENENFPPVVVVAAAAAAAAPVQLLLRPLSRPWKRSD